MDYEETLRVLTAFEREGVKYTIFGAAALNLHGYVPPTGAFHVDLLTRLGDAFRYEDLEVLRLPLGPLTVSVVSPHTLYRMKRDTVRLKDRADAELLKERFGLDEDA